MRPNIVWILVDSIRNYPTSPELDHRGKLPFMEEIAPLAVEFETVVTTAPSTIMSVTGMMTGVPAYYLARSYDQFRFDSSYFYSLGNILKRHGYHGYAFLRGTETREKFRTFLDMVPRELWAEHHRHSDKWKNEDLLLLLENVIEAEPTRPSFMFFHFNPQTGSNVDPDIDDRVRTCWKMLNDAGYTPENTIFVLCSDHGFPDPTKGLTTEWEQKTRIPHDLVLTDDNILIPLYLVHAGLGPGKVPQPVSSLDIFPTLLELAGVPGRDEVEQVIEGRSLLPVIRGEGEPRQFFRCDNRLMLQRGRVTAIRSSRYKYLHMHDDYRPAEVGPTDAEGEVFLDLVADPAESENLLRKRMSPDAEQALEEHRRSFRESEQRALAFQINYMLGQFTDGEHDRLAERADIRNVLLVVEPDAAGFGRIGAAAVSQLYPDAAIDLLVDAPTAQTLGSGAWTVHEYAAGASAAPGSVMRTASGDGFDIVFTFVRDPDSGEARGAARLAQKVPARKHILLDSNFNPQKGNKYFRYRLRVALDRLRRIPSEPEIALSVARSAAFIVRRAVLRRLGLWERAPQPGSRGAGEE